MTKKMRCCPYCYKEGKLEEAKFHIGVRNSFGTIKVFTCEQHEKQVSEVITAMSNLLKVAFGGN